MSDAPTQAPCPVCHEPLTLRLTHGRKSGKAFLMLICAQDGRHFRGFINDRTFVGGVLSRLESHNPGENTGVDPEDGADPSRLSKTNLERGS